MKKIKKKNKAQSKIAQLFIVLAISSLSIGFAYIQTILAINGKTTIANLSGSFDVIFDNVTVTEGSVNGSSLPQIDVEDPTKINFAVSLKSVDDFYEFEVDMLNRGNKDAMISDIYFNGISNNLLKYLEHSIKYSDGMEIKKNDILPASSSERITIRLGYKEEATRAPELFGDGLKSTFSIVIRFTASDGNGKLKQKPSLLYNLGLVEDANIDTELSFGNAASDTNGKGLYVRSGTEKEAYPIYYYRGNVTDNNVLFAGFCWKIIRTTETGGTKIIYNGSPNSSNQCTNTTGTATQLSSLSKFNDNDASLADAGFKYGPRYSYYSQELSTINEPFSENDYIVKSNTELTPFNYDSATQSWISSNHSDSSKGIIEFSVAVAGNYYLNYKASSESYDKATIKKNGTQIGKSYYSGLESGILELNELKETDVIQIQYAKDSSKAANDDNFSFSIGKIIDPDDVVYGSSFDYVNDEYILKNPKNITNWGENYLSAKNLYTCIDLDGKCTRLSYILLTDSTKIYYIYLTKGEKLEDILSNQNESTVLNTLNTWYENNIENDSAEKHYEQYLEDTVWCNNRTLSSISSNSFYFDTTRKLTLSAKEPNPAVKENLACPNENDRFTVGKERGNGALTHPIGLITADEATLAGNGYLGYSTTASYLYTNQSYWTMTPYYFSNNSIYIYSISSNGRLVYSLAPTSSSGVRPVLSLKDNVKVSSGNGTANTPYVIETN